MSHHRFTTTLTIVGALAELLDATEHEWMASAVCAQTDPEAFHPEAGDSPEPAKRMCAHCPVRETCLQWALDHNEPDGIWGGLTASERWVMRRHGWRSTTDREEAITAHLHAGQSVTAVGHTLGVPRRLVRTLAHQSQHQRAA